MAKAKKTTTGEFCVLFNESTGERKPCSVTDSALFFENSAEAGNFVIEDYFETLEDAWTFVTTV